MEVLVDSTGRRVFINSPRIDQADQKRNVLLYDPNGYNLGTGLYERARPACGRWVDYFWQHERMYRSPPAYSIDSDGVIHPPAVDRSGYPAYPRPTTLGPRVGQYSWTMRG